jgi:hypothetical protein
MSGKHRYSDAGVSFYHDLGLFILEMGVTLALGGL